MCLIYLIIRQVNQIAIQKPDSLLCNMVVILRCNQNQVFLLHKVTRAQTMFGKFINTIYKNHITCAFKIDVFFYE